MLKLNSALIMATITLTACSHSEYASNLPRQYLQAKNGPALSVPNDLTKSNLSDFYTLEDPPANTKLTVSIRPPQSSTS